MAKSIIQEVVVAPGWGGATTTGTRGGSTMPSFTRHRSLRRFGVLAATAVTLAGTLQAVATPGAALAAAPSDHVVFWNDVLLQAFRDAGGAPGPLARAGA